MRMHEDTAMRRVAINAIVVKEAGPPSVLRPAPATLAHPTGSQLLIAVHVAGVNYWDVMQRRGEAPLPTSEVPGGEGVGVVVECGPDAPTDLLSRRVAWSKVPGSYADHVLAQTEWVIEVPPGLPDEVAGGVLSQGVTAQYLADDTCPLGEGDTAVVFAAAGGVGSLLTQWLRHRHVRVVGVVGSPGKVAAAAESGAEHVIVDGETLVERVRALVPSGVSAVFDANGGPAAARGFDLLRIRGMLVLYGTAAGPLPILDSARLGNGSLYFTRTSGKDYVGTAAQWQRRAALVLARAASGELRVRVGGCVALERAAELHELLESRASTGKLLLQVTSVG